MVLVRLSQPSQQSVSAGLALRALIGRQQIHVGDGSDPIGPDLVVMVTAVAAAVAVDEPPVLVGRPVAETRLSQANDDGGQR